MSEPKGWKKERSRCWNLLLYPDDPTHADALDKIQTSGEYQFVGCCHNLDSDENGELKKEHFHLILSFENARENYSLARELGIEVNYIQKTKSWNDSARYLLHFGCEDKFQYTPDTLVGTSTLIDKVKKLLDTRTESESILGLLDWIDEQQRRISTSELNRQALKQGVWAAYRRAGLVLMRSLDEHNLLYTPTN